MAGDEGERRDVRGRVVIVESTQRIGRDGSTHRQDFCRASVVIHPDDHAEAHGVATDEDSVVRRCERSGDGARPERGVLIGDAEVDILSRPVDQRAGRVEQLQLQLVTAGSKIVRPRRARGWGAGKRRSIEVRRR
jgi:hypothetical protein